MTEQAPADREPIVIAASDDRLRKIVAQSAKEERRGKLFRRIVRIAFLACFATAVGGVWFDDRYPFLIWPAGISILLLIPLLPLAIFSGAFIPGNIRFLMNDREKKAYRE